MKFRSAFHSEIPSLGARVFREEAPDICATRDCVLSGILVLQRGFKLRPECTLAAALSHRNNKR